MSKAPKTDVLETHGTVMGGLSPVNVLQAAEEDFKRKASNSRNAKTPKRTGREYERFAFHRKHVRKAKNARGLLALAIQEQGVGTMSHKKNTRLLYKDTMTLHQALVLAVEKYPDPTGAEEIPSTTVDKLPEAVT